MEEEILVVRAWACGKAKQAKRLGFADGRHLRHGNILGSLFYRMETINDEVLNV